jgi:hypothetical protein
MITATRVLGFSTVHLMKMPACPFPRLALFFFHVMLDHVMKPDRLLIAGLQISDFAPPGAAACLSAAR